MERAKPHWEGLPRSATAMVFARAFCLFAAIGMMLGVLNATQATIGQAWVTAAIAGVFAVGWAFAGFRRVLWLLIVLFSLQAAANFVAGAAPRRWVRARPTKPSC